MAQQLRPLVAFPQALSSVPSTQVRASYLPVTSAPGALLASVGTVQASPQHTRT